MVDPQGRRGAMAKAKLVPEPVFDSWVGLARNIAISGIAGLFTGILVGGVGGRLFMRLAGAAAPDLAQGRRTEAGFTVGEVTLSGSLELVIFIGLFTGIAGAIIYVAFSPWLSWARRWRGVLFGVVLFAIGSATSDIMNPDNFDFFILKNPVLLVIAIFLLFVVFGIVIDTAFRFLDQRLPPVDDNVAGVAAPYIMLSLVGVLLFILVLPGFFSGGRFCDCDPPVAASLAMVLAGIGTLLWWATALFTAMPAWSRRVAGFVGYAGLIGVLLFGLVRAISDAIEIIS
jgi:hypothetical protein